MPTSPILYSFRRCPYAMRARMSLVYSQQTVELREVLLKDKPADLLAISPKGTVPVLLCEDGRVIEESLEIMLWALNKADPNAWLTQEKKQEQRQFELITANDKQFKALLDRYKYADRFPEFSEQYHREQCFEFLRRLEEKLAKHTFLFGEQPCLADIAIFPFIRQFAHVDLEWFEASSWHKLQRWLNYFKKSDLFTRSMTKYPTWENGDSPVHFPPAIAFGV